MTSTNEPDLLGGLGPPAPPQPASPPQRAAEHELKMTKETGSHGGPSYSYRGATILCMRGGHVCSLWMDGHPLHGVSFGGPTTITHHVDRWVDEGIVASWLKVNPEVRRKILGQAATQRT